MPAAVKKKQHAAPVGFTEQLCKHNRTQELLSSVYACWLDLLHSRSIYAEDDKRANKWQKKINI